MMPKRNRTLWVATIALLVAGMIWAAPGDVVVTDQGFPGTSWTKKSIAFTLNGTTPVTTTIVSVSPIRAGSIDAILATTPAGTVTLSAYNGDVFTAVGQKDMVSEAFTSETLRVGIFEVYSTGGYALAPSRITLSIVSTSTADTTISGTALVSLVN